MLLPLPWYPSDKGVKHDAAICRTVWVKVNLHPRNTCRFLSYVVIRRLIYSTGPRTQVNRYWYFFIPLPCCVDLCIISLWMRWPTLMSHPLPMIDEITLNHRERWYRSWGMPPHADKHKRISIVSDPVSLASDLDCCNGSISFLLQSQEEKGSSDKVIDSNLLQTSVFLSPAHSRPSRTNSFHIASVCLVGDDTLIGARLSNKLVYCSSLKRRI